MLCSTKPVYSGRSTKRENSGRVNGFLCQGQEKACPLHMAALQSRDLFAMYTAVFKLINRISEHSPRCSKTKSEEKKHKDLKTLQIKNRKPGVRQVSDIF